MSWILLLTSVLFRFPVLFFSLYSLIVLFSSLLLSFQDFPISVSIIWNHWRSNKVSDRDCERELIRCKDRTSPAALESLQKLQKRAEILELEDEIRYVQETLESRQCRFRDHDVIAKFMKQFDKSNYAVLYRRHSLVLLGDSQQGKTQSRPGKKRRISSSSNRKRWPT